MVIDPMTGCRDQRVAPLIANIRDYSLGNILLLTNPDIFRLCLDSLQELFESHKTTGSSNDMRVQRQSHHLWLALLTFGKQDVQGIVEVFQEVVWTREPGRIYKLVVVAWGA